MKNRKKIESHVLKYISLIDTSGINKKMYEDLFNKWSDKQFKLWMEALKKGDGFVTIIVPTSGKVDLDTGNNIRIGKQLGINFFQGFSYAGGGVAYKVTTPTLIAHYNIRRLKQHAIKGISTPDDTKSRNVMTGQVTGKSKSGRLTSPEVDVLVGMGLHNAIKELLGTRGGNAVATRKLVSNIMETGEVSLKELEPYLDGRTSVKTLASIFKAMHIETNF